MGADPGPSLRPAPMLVVGVGASAGGVEALSSFVSTLPRSFPGAILVVLHIAPGVPSVLPQILARRCPLHVTAAADGLELRGGHVYVAPPDNHVLVRDGVVRLSRGAQENGHRPAVDPMLRSIAAGYGPSSAGIVLSGTRDDGTAGLARIKAVGGRALVQDPEEALYPGMPLSAMTHVEVDAVLGVEALALDITRHAGLKDNPSMAGTDPAWPEPDVAEPTRFTCPDCGGMLRRQVDSGVEQYACSVGHVYSPESLDGAQEMMVEGALWAGSRLLEDRATFLQSMAERAERLEHTHSAARFRERAEEAMSRSRALRALTEGPMGDTSEEGAA